MKKKRVFFFFSQTAEFVRPRRNVESCYYNGVSSSSSVDGSVYLVSRSEKTESSKVVSKVCRNQGVGTLLVHECDCKLGDHIRAFGREGGPWGPEGPILPAGNVHVEWPYGSSLFRY